MRIWESLSQKPWPYAFSHQQKTQETDNGTVRRKQASMDYYKKEERRERRQRGEKTGRPTMLVAAAGIGRPWSSSGSGC
jgi:hypothetical protein